jgi:hypothetical protein
METGYEDEYWMETSHSFAKRLVFVKKSTESWGPFKLEHVMTVTEKL